MRQYPFGKPFDWGKLGYDDGGLPIHLPFPITKNGEGPAIGKDVHHWECWCVDPLCSLTVALRVAHHTALRQTFRVMLKHALGFR